MPGTPLGAGIPGTGQSELSEYQALPDSQLLTYHFGVGAPPISVNFGGDWDAHTRYGILTHGHVCRRENKPAMFGSQSPRSTGLSEALRACALSISYLSDARDDVGRGVPHCVGVLLHEAKGQHFFRGAWGSSRLFRTSRDG